MSDIPIGSPPAPPGRHAAPSGWYPDPVDPAQERYWDGWQWSRNTRLRDLGSGSAPVGPSRTAGPAPAPYAGPTGPAGSYASRPQRPGQTPVPLTADGVPLAGWGRRALAATLDAVISYFLVGFLLTPFYAPLTQVSSDYVNAVFVAQREGGPPPEIPIISDYISTRDQVLAAVVLFAFFLAYNVLFLRWKAATPGKMALGIRVVPLDQGRTTAQLAWGTTLTRSVLWLLPRLAGYLPSTVGLFLGLRLADVLLPLRHPKRQSLHDIVARTQVVRSR